MGSLLNKEKFVSFQNPGPSYLGCSEPFSIEAGPKLLYLSQAPHQSADMEVYLSWCFTLSAASVCIAFNASSVVASDQTTLVSGLLASW
ncbi:hypothetical protein D9M70_589170 [compost metagenome]